MLHELRNAAQNKNEKFRRIFEDQDFDLYVWFESEPSEENANANPAIHGFQVVYNKQTVSEALMWDAAHGFKDYLIDEGESSPLANRAPMLVTAEKSGWTQMLMEKFVEAARGLEYAIADFVISKLRAFQPAE